MPVRALYGSWELVGTGWSYLGLVWAGYGEFAVVKAVGAGLGSLGLVVCSLGLVGAHWGSSRLVETSCGSMQLVRAC